MRRLHASLLVYGVEVGSARRIPSAAGWCLASALILGGAPALVVAQEEPSAGEATTSIPGTSGSPPTDPATSDRAVTAASGYAGNTGSTSVSSGPGAEAARGPAAGSDERSDEDVLRAALAWRESRGEGALPGGWAHAADVVDPVGVEIGARVVVGALVGDPWGLRLLDASAGPQWSWGARAHIGYSFGAVALRVEGGVVRHEVVAPQGLSATELAALEVPVELHLRWSVPDTTVGFVIEAGGGVSMWSIPLRASESAGLERVEGAWTGRAEMSVGVRLVSYVDVLVTCGVVLPDDLGGTGPVLSDATLFLGGSVGFIFGAYE